MIKKFLDDLRVMIQDLGLASSFDVSKTIEDLIKADKARLASKTVPFLDGPEGFIDCYAIDAEQQLQHKRALLEQYAEALTYLLAVLIGCRDLASEELTQGTMKDLKKNPRLQNIIQKLHKVDKRNSRLSEIKVNLLDETISDELKSQLRAEQTNLETQNAPFNDLLQQHPIIQRVFKKRKKCLFHLNVHLELQKKIPMGMLDVKRAISVALKKNKIRNIPDFAETAAALRYSDDKVEEQKIHAMLCDLHKIMLKSVKDYQSLIIAGGDLNLFLHKTTGFYWENVLFYRGVLAGVHRYLSQTSHLTHTGRMIASCIEKSLAEVPSEEILNNAISRVKRVDACLSEREAAYGRQSGNNIRFIRKKAYHLLQSMLQDNSKAYFHVPYSAFYYVLDHPPELDLADSAGNCHGEAMMFLQLINANIPSFNTIAPDKYLNNFQINPKMNIRHHDIKIIDSASVQSRITWNDISDALKKKPESPLGDLCILKFGNAIYNGKMASHSLAVIKLRNPSPYRYVVYDFNIGAMGFSELSHIETYLEKIIGMAPWQSFELEKQGAVSQPCWNFIQSIKPLTNHRTPEEIPEAERTRQFWDVERLEMMKRYDSETTVQQELPHQKTSEDEKFLQDIEKPLSAIREMALSLTKADGMMGNSAEGLVFELDVAVAQVSQDGHVETLLENLTDATKHAESVLSQDLSHTETSTNDTLFPPPQSNNAFSKLWIKLLVSLKRLMDKIQTHIINFCTGLNVFR